MDKKQNEKSAPAKITTFIFIIAFCAWIVFVVLEFTTSMKFASLGNYASICVICVCEAVSYWNVKRYMSYISIGVMLCMATLMILDIVLPA